MALGSACELETQLILSKDLGYISLDEVEQLTIEVQNIIKMLAALIKSLGK
ncbi:MAG: four helix bundle protein [Segatella sp.]